MITSIIRYICLFGLFLVLNTSCGNSENPGPSNDPDPDPTPEVPQNLIVADPTIFKNGDTYYLYGTDGRGANNGFPVYTSTNLEDWVGPKGRKNGFALSADDAFGTSGFWAPQVLSKDNNTFYMYYTANEKIAFATATSPLGVFANLDKRTISTGENKIIDPFVFTDDDGTSYLYHVRVKEGNKIFVAELNDDMATVKLETLTECITATEEWENTESANWTVTEGPTVIKHNDLYYLIYSANDFRSVDYAVGFATSTSPYGPWEKSSKNPIINKELTGHNGSGHGDLFADDNQLYYVFHTHNNSAQVSPRKTALIKLNFVSEEGSPDYLSADESSFSMLEYTTR